jgi:diadenosine tetraphosphatase ApaH/serine/threonine PP2A family protein phosphatase
LRLAHEGYERVYFDEPCSCGHRHREYRYMKNGGSLAEIEEIVRWCLERIGEADAKR